MYVNQRIIEKPEQDFWSKSESYKPNRTILEVCDVIKFKYKKHVQFLVKCIYGIISPTFSCPAVFYFARDLKIVSIILRLWCLVISKVFTFFWACELSASFLTRDWRLKVTGAFAVRVPVGSFAWGTQAAYVLNHLLHCVLFGYYYNLSFLFPFICFLACCSYLWFFF